MPISVGKAFGFIVLDFSLIFQVIKGHLLNNMAWLDIKFSFDDAFRALGLSKLGS